MEQAQGYFAGGDPWTFPELYDTMERQDVEAFLASGEAGTDISRGHPSPGGTVMNTVTFPGLGLEFTIDPVAFSIGTFQIYWYG